MLTFCQCDLSAITKVDELLKVDFFAWLDFQSELFRMSIVGPLFELSPCTQSRANVGMLDKKRDTRW